MNTLRLLPALLGCVLALATAAQAAPDQPGEQALVGIWQEYEPASNLVQFFPDHTMRIYLTREEGGALNLHWIGGSWSLAPDLTLTMTLSANGNSMTDRVKVTFEQGEMWLLDAHQAATRHRRLSGEMPARFRW